MFGFELATEDTKRQHDMAALADDITAKSIDKSFGSGAYAVLTGIPRAGMQLAELGLEAATPTIGKGIDSVFGSGETAQEWIEWGRQKARGASKYLAPNEATTHYIAHIGHDLTRTLTVGGVGAAGGFVAGTATTGVGGAGGAVAGAGGLIGLVEGQQAYYGAREQGVDRRTAQDVALLAGGMSALGAFIPMGLSARLTASLAPAMRGAANVGAGAAIQTSQGMAQRIGTAALLDNAGYKDMARQYEAMDARAIVTDAVLGGLFGYAGYRHQKSMMEPIRKGEFKPQSQDLDAALAMNNQHHLELDTAPGLIPTPDARNTHIEALVQATKDLLAGDPVNVGAKPGQVDFIANPHTDAMRAEIGRAVEERLGPELVARANEIARGVENRPAMPKLEDLPPLPDGVRVVSEGGSFGHALEGFAGRWQEARAWLESAKFGEVLDVLTHPEINDRIGLPYGMWDGKNGYGLAKLIGKHPEMLDNLPEYLANMNVISRSNNRVLLESESHKGVIRLDFDAEQRTWLATAYEKTGGRNSGRAEDSRSLPNDGVAPRPHTDLNSDQRPLDTLGANEQAARLSHTRAPSDGNPIAQQRETGNHDPYSAQSIAHEKPNMAIMDEEGKPTTARDLLARHDEDISIAKEEAQAFDIAAACALRNDL